MNLMTQRRPREPTAHGSDPVRTGPRRTASGDARRRQGGWPAARGTRQSSPGFRPPSRLGSRALQSQQAELSGMDARPLAERSCWVATGARGTEHPQADRGPVVIHKFVLTERNPETRGTLVAPRSHGGVGERIGRLWCEAGQLAW